LFNQAVAEAKGGWQPQLPLEMAFIEASLPMEGSAAAATGSPPRGAATVSTATQSSSRPRPPSPSSSRVEPAPPPRSQAGVRESAPAYGNVAGVDLTPGVLQQRWDDVLNAMRPRNLSLEALMRSCRPVSVEGDVVVLGFDYDFHRAKVEEDHNRRDVEDVLSELMGQRYRVRCVLTHTATIVARSSPAAAEEGGRSPKPFAVEDPVARVAMEELGATVIEQ
jgi:DNA polymerase-3 subunit gamma/tau